ncbi:hypothetical protein BJV82DRAFT_667752 [Fennellomyces sp. T-0311]|nr:hypothetical protein BJV82DRAFT_667752 [Fennellomyces sp. T-0311]
MAMDETNQENFEEFWSLLKEVNDEQRYESSDTLKDYSKTNSLTEGSSENQQLSLKSTSALAEISLKTGTQEQPESDPAAILSTHPSDTYDALMGYPLRSDVSFSIEQQPEIPSVQTITLTDVQPSTSHNHQFYDRQQWTRWDHQIQTNDQVTPLTLASDTLANQPLFSCINMSTNGASTDIIPRAERCNNDRDGNQSLDNSDNRSAGSNSPKRKDRKNYFECYFPGCTKQFGRRKDLDRHVPTHDKKNDRYLYFDCTKCGHEKRYTRKDKFDEHVRNCKGKAPQKKPSQKAKV